MRGKKGGFLRLSVTNIKIAVLLYKNLIIKL